MTHPFLAAVAAPLEGIVVLRPVRDDDGDFLERLFFVTRSVDLPPLPPPALEPLLRMQHDAERAAHAARFPDALHVILEQEGRPVGRLVMDLQPDAVHGVDFALLPDTRNNGLGGHVIVAVLAETDRTGRSVTLSVTAHNPAIRLYRRLGFVETGRSGPMIAMTRPPAGSEAPPP